MKNDKRFYVYGYFEPGSEVPFYIGKGKGCRSRQHLWSSYLTKKSPFYCKLRAMIASGVSPRVEILHADLTEVEALRLEIAMIEKHGRKDLGTGPLCNLTGGGDGLINPSEVTRRKMAVNTGRRLPEVTKARMSESHRGRTASVDTRKKLSSSLQGRVITPEWRGKIGAGNLGKIRSIEFRENLSRTQKGASRTAESRKKMSTAQRQVKGRPVQSLNPLTGEFKRYTIMSDVIADGFSQGNVSECCNGKRSTHRGLAWSYCADESDRPDDCRTSGIRPDS